MAKSTHFASQLGAESPEHVPRTETAAGGGQRGVVALAARGARVRAAASHSIGADGKEQVPVGIDEPPLAIHLLDAEEARRLGFGAQVTAVAAIVEVAGAEILFLLRPLGLQLRQAFDLAGPVGENPLSELIHHRLGLEDLRAGVLLGEPDRPYLERWLADRILHGEAQGLDRADRAVRAAHAHPERVSELVSQRRQVEALAVRPLEILEWNGGADPRAPAIQLQPHVSRAIGGVDAEAHSLRGRRLQFQDQVVVAGPVGWQIGVEVFQRPLDARKLRPGKRPAGFRPRRWQARRQEVRAMRLTFDTWRTSRDWFERLYFHMVVQRGGIQEHEPHLLGAMPWLWKRRAPEISGIPSKRTAPQRPTDSSAAPLRSSSGSGDGSHCEGPADHLLNSLGYVACRFLAKVIQGCECLALPISFAP